MGSVHINGLIAIMKDYESTTINAGGAVSVTEDTREAATQLRAELSRLVAEKAMLARQWAAFDTMGPPVLVGGARRWNTTRYPLDSLGGYNPLPNPTVATAPSRPRPQSNDAIDQRIKELQRTLAQFSY